MADEQKRIIEIEGVKLEVDLRHAKRVDTLKVGDMVKVLKKEYSGHVVKPGVVVGFEPFEQRPTIVVAYLEVSYNKVEMEFLYFNSASEDVEIIASIDPESLSIQRADILAKFDNEVVKKENEILDIQRKKQYFMDMFGKYFPEMEQTA